MLHQTFKIQRLSYKQDRVSLVIVQVCVVLVDVQSNDGFTGNNRLYEHIELVYNVCHKSFCQKK